MMARTHKLGGIAAGLTVVSTKAYLPNVGMNNFFGKIPFLAGCYVGSLFCDVDTGKSTISKKLWFIAWIYHLMQAIINLLIRNPKSKILKNIKSTANHRGLMHWLSLNILGILCLIIASYIVKNSFGIDFHITFINQDINKSIYQITLNVVFNFFYGFFIGCISHIVLDSFNPTGVPLFAPFSFRRINLGNIVTSNTSIGELRFRFLLKVITVCLIIYCFYSALIAMSFIDNSIITNTLNSINLIKGKGP